MLWFVIKVLVSAVIIALVSELSKRSTVAGAVLASLPLVSVLGMIWLYVDTRDTAQVAQLSRDVFWLVIPSLILFVLLPLLLKAKLAFAPALGISMAATVVGYFCMLSVIKLIRA